MEKLRAAGAGSKVSSIVSKNTTPAVAEPAKTQVQPNSLPKMISIALSIFSSVTGGFRKAASVMDEMMNQPTLILAGESGA